MSSRNEAAWVDEVGEKLRIREADIGKPGTGEVLIKTHAIAINPIDFARQDTGIFVSKWPTVLGSDIAGEVIEVGEDVTEINKGDRVLAQALGLRTGKPENGAFQKYVVVLATGSCPIPENITYEEASVIPLALSTAAVGLYQSDYLALPFPNTGAQRIGKTILIWGGSSSVGSCAIQLALASGLDVVTTASTKNFKYCVNLGAKEVFDHYSPNIIINLTAALQKTNLAGIYDAIGKSTPAIVEILNRLGGGFIASVKPPSKDSPKSVQVKQVAGSLINEEVKKAVWKDFLLAALKNGDFKPAPDPDIIGTGLEHLQTGLEKLKRGISASKIVVVV